MRRMTEKIIAIGCLALLVLCLSACTGKTFECDLCSEEKSGKSHTTEFMGQSVTICDDCYKELSSLLG